MSNTPENGNNALIEACIVSAPANTSARNSLRAGELFSVGRRDNDYASLAGFFRSKGASESEIAKLLKAIDAVVPTPHGEDNINRISNSITRYEVKPDFFTHDSFAKLLATELKQTVRYCNNYGFLVYDDGYWQHDSEMNLVTYAVRQILDQVRAHIERLKPQIEEEKYNKLKKAAKKLESASFMRDSIKLLKTDPAIRIKLNELDEQRHLVNLANGTLNLDTATLQPFNPDDHLTFKLDVVYDREADCPLFRQFLKDILPDETAEFVLRILGYALLGHGLEQKFFIFQGSGKNGKSTLLDIAGALFGSMLVTIQPESLNGRMEGAVRNDLARLVNKRIMVTSETKAGTVLDAALMKQITGLDVLTARFLHKEYFEFKANCVPILVTNHAPVISGEDSAMARRICMVSFDHIIQQVDNELSAKLKAEQSGVFNLILKAMQDYKANGLCIPASVQQRTEAFIEKSNLMKGFCDDRLEYDKTAKLPAHTAYSQYVGWCGINGYKPMSINQFKDAFERSTGIQQERDNQSRCWPGLRLKAKH